MTRGESDTSQGAPAIGIAPPGYRLPAATRIGAVRLQVADLDRSLAYYEGVLGFRLLGREAGAATLGAHGDDAPLLRLRERPGAHPIPRRGRLGLFHVAYLLPDRAALGRFLRHLGELGAHAGMSDHLVSEAVYLSDPDGLGIEVYADRPRAEWERDGRQLRMTTEPMDVRGVLAAGGDEPWRGAPAGTVVGHVHLSVDDLARGEAFYHVGLGLDKIVWGYPGALFMSAGGYHHHLGTNTWAAGSPVAGEEDARLLEWELLLPTTTDVDAALDSLAAAGHAARRAEGSGVVRDPWGIEVRLSALGSRLSATAP